MAQPHGGGVPLCDLQAQYREIGSQLETAVSRVLASGRVGLVLLHPREPAFSPDSAVAWIEIDYPSRPSWFYGSKTWMISWFVVSLAAGFLLRGVVGVNL